jgi:hypothetical protein
MTQFRPLARVRALGPTQAYKTYAVKSPLNSHYRKATCQEINCHSYLNGWYFFKDALDERLLYAATHSGRKYIEKYMDEGGMLLGDKVVQGTYLVYPAGQTCFKIDSHVISLQRPELYFVGRGDYRSFNTRNAKQHTSPANFVDDWTTHMDYLNTRAERG